MEFNEIIQKALEIREKYSKLEKKKYGKEWTRVKIAHGFTGDVSDLIKLIEEKERKTHVKNIDYKIAHELSDCLWSILILADKYGIDLEKSFIKTMAELKERINSEL